MACLTNADADSYVWMPVILERRFGIFLLLFVPAVRITAELGHCIDIWFIEAGNRVISPTYAVAPDPMFCGNIVKIVKRSRRGYTDIIYSHYWTLNFKQRLLTHTSPPRRREVSELAAVLIYRVMLGLIVDITNTISFNS